MYDSAQAQAIRDRAGQQAPITGSEQRDADQAVDVLWGVHTDLTAQLQEFGVAPKAFCEQANAVAEARNEIREQAGHRQ